MKKTILIGAGSDLGVHIDGASLGPKTILNKLNSLYHLTIIFQTKF